MKNLKISLKQKIEKGIKLLLFLVMILTILVFTQSKNESFLYADSVDLLFEYYGIENDGSVISLGSSKKIKNRDVGDIDIWLDQYERTGEKDGWVRYFSGWEFNYQFMVSSYKSKNELTWHKHNHSVEEWGYLLENFRLTEKLSYILNTADVFSRCASKNWLHEPLANYDDDGRTKYVGAYYVYSGKRSSNGKYGLYLKIPHRDKSKNKEGNYDQNDDEWLEGTVKIRLYYRRQGTPIKVYVDTDRAASNKRMNGMGVRHSVTWQFKKSGRKTRSYFGAVHEDSAAYIVRYFNKIKSSSYTKNLPVQYIVDGISQPINHEENMSMFVDKNTIFSGGSTSLIYNDGWFNYKRFGSDALLGEINHVNMDGYVETVGLVSPYMDMNNKNSLYLINSQFRNISYPLIYPESTIKYNSNILSSTVMSFKTMLFTNIDKLYIYGNTYVTNNFNYQYFSRGKISHNNVLLPIQEFPYANEIKCEDRYIKDGIDANSVTTYIDESFKGIIDIRVDKVDVNKVKNQQLLIAKIIKSSNKDLMQKLYDNGQVRIVNNARFDVIINDNNLYIAEPIKIVLNYKNIDGEKLFGISSDKLEHYKKGANVFLEPPKYIPSYEFSYAEVDSENFEVSKGGVVSGIINDERIIEINYFYNKKDIEKRSISFEIYYKNELKDKYSELTDMKIDNLVYNVGEEVNLTFEDEFITYVEGEKFITNTNSNYKLSFDDLAILSNDNSLKYSINNVYGKMPDNDVCIRLFYTGIKEYSYEYDSYDINKFSIKSIDEDGNYLPFINKKSFYYDKLKIDENLPSEKGFNFKKVEHSGYWNNGNAIKKSNNNISGDLISDDLNVFCIYEKDNKDSYIINFQVLDANGKRINENIKNILYLANEEVNIEAYNSSKYALLETNIAQKDDSLVADSDGKIVGTMPNSNVYVTYVVKPLEFKKLNFKSTTIENANYKISFEVENTDTNKLEGFNNKISLNGFDSKTDANKNTNQLKNEVAVDVAIKTEEVRGWTFKDMKDKNLIPKVVIDEENKDYYLFDRFYIDKNNNNLYDAGDIAITDDTIFTEETDIKVLIMKNESKFTEIKFDKNNEFATLDESKIKTKIYKDNTLWKDIEKPEIKVANCYLFDGWYDSEGNKMEDDKLIKKNETYVAHFSKNSDIYGEIKIQLDAVGRIDDGGNPYIEIEDAKEKYTYLLVDKNGMIRNKKTGKDSVRFISEEGVKLNSAHVVYAMEVEAEKIEAGKLVSEYKDYKNMQKVVTTPGIKDYQVEINEEEYIEENKNVGTVIIAPASDEVEYKLSNENYETEWKKAERGQVVFDNLEVGESYQVRIKYGEEETDGVGPVVVVEKGLIKDKWSVVVINGEEIVKYEYSEGATVELQTDKEPFEKWICLDEEVKIENANERNTTFTMPAKNVVVKVVKEISNANLKLTDKFYGQEGYKVQMIEENEKEVIEQFVGEVELDLSNNGFDIEYKVKYTEDVLSEVEKEAFKNISLEDNENAITINVDIERYLDGNLVEEINFDDGDNANNIREIFGDAIFDKIPELKMYEENVVSPSNETENKKDDYEEEAEEDGLAEEEYNEYNDYNDYNEEDVVDIEEIDDEEKEKIYEDISKEIEIGNLENMFELEISGFAEGTDNMDVSQIYEGLKLFGANTEKLKEVKIKTAVQLPEVHQEYKNYKVYESDGNNLKEVEMINSDEIAKKGVISFEVEKGKRYIVSYEKNGMVSFTNSYIGSGSYGSQIKLLGRSEELEYPELNNFVKGDVEYINGRWEKDKTEQNGNDKYVAKYDEREYIPNPTEEQIQSIFGALLSDDDLLNEIINMDAIDDNIDDDITIGSIGSDFGNMYSPIFGDSIEKIKEVDIER